MRAAASDPGEVAPLDTARFRTCLGRFATGVTVVAFREQAGSPRGITVNAFTSVSLDPPLVLVAIARAARSHDLLGGHPFSVSVLKVEQEPLARHFAGPPQDRELQPQWVEGRVAPRLAGCLAWMECEPWASYEGGDHTLYVGRVVNFDAHDGDALGFYCSRFVSVPRPVPSQPPLPYDPFELPYDAL